MDGTGGGVSQRVVQLKRQLWPFNVTNCWTGTVAAADLDGAGV